MYKKQVLTLMAAICGTILLTSTQPALAFPHALTVVTPNTSDPNQEHAKPILVVLGHTNEPTYGKLAGVHDGKHNVEVFLEDQATALPLKGADLKIDKYYFRTVKGFEKASSPEKATSVQKGIPVGAAFGDPGHYIARQVQKEGIYGYRLYGTINYFDVGKVPIDATVFCRMSNGTDLSKFNTPGWFGGYGCTDSIRDIMFPPRA